MCLIDFDQKFHEYLEGWLKKNAAKYKNADELEERTIEAYLGFLNRPADWLDGETPAEYFAKYSDPQELVGWLRAYEAGGVAIPDLLMERIEQLGEVAVPPLMELAADAGAPGALRAAALNILREIGTEAPLPLCLSLVDGREDEDELADIAAEILDNLGSRAVPAMLSRLEGASDAALRSYLDLLCNFPGDERIYSYTRDLFLRDAANRALCAACLGKLGDPRAVKPLRQMMDAEDINYLDYLEIANAIEMLGEEAPPRDREFHGDPYYESLKNL